MDIDIKTIIDLTETEPDKVAFAVYQNQEKDDEHVLGIFEKDTPVNVVITSFVHLEALYITLHEYFNTLDMLPDVELEEPLDKNTVMQNLQKLYTEDQQCSGSCDICQYEIACNKLQPMLEDLFGYQG
ncbi:MAG: hypothetical protein ACOZCL_08585 [Bacillota bacterium]